LKHLAKSYTTNGAGGLAETSITIAKPGTYSSHNRTIHPSGGLFSTAEDMFHFYQMVLNGGVWNGKRIVSEPAVKEMTQVQTGDLKTGFTEGMGFGLGWGVIRRPVGVTGMLSPGTFGHGGAYGTQGWIDPERKMIFVLMIQRAHLKPNGDDNAVRTEFQQAAVDALLP
jgi:CubicO group peptidase (beta-lactamase class C family)